MVEIVTFQTAPIPPVQHLERSRYIRIYGNTALRIQLAQRTTHFTHGTALSTYVFTYVLHYRILAPHYVTDSARRGRIPALPEQILALSEGGKCWHARPAHPFMLSS